MVIVTPNNPIRPSTKIVAKGVWISLKETLDQLKGRKSMGQIQEEINIQNTLERTLNWIQLTAIGLGGIIGNYKRENDVSEIR